MNTIQYKRLLICLFSFIQVITVCADENPFKMVYCAASETVINTTYNTTDTIDISNINEGINGLSLDCEILRLSKNGFVRILLEDTSGKDFIVLESNKFRNNNDSITYEDYCEETSSLSNIHPQLLKIYIKDAIVTLNKIKYSTTSNSSSLEYTSELLNADSIRKKQVSQIVKDINNSGIERATCSKWVSHKDLSLIALPFSTTYLNPCKDIKEIQKKWKEAIAIGEINSESLELSKQPVSHVIET